ncbi:MAG: hypothetical protein ABIQ35_15910 [Verrucomicrobiota bacterium]
MTEELQMRIFGGEELPTLIYLPGTHGDWTLNGGFRRKVANRVRLIEFTFPRTLEWSLEDYASNVEQKLAENNIGAGWILAESFSSQIAWAMAGRNSTDFRIQAMILAGGFVRHPVIPSVRLAKTLTERIPLWLLRMMLKGYSVYACARENNSIEIRAELKEFVERRTKDDLRAAAHRLDLIAHSDLRSIARASKVRLFYLTGLVDPIVPWPLVRPWVKKNCMGYQDERILFGSDHHVLGSAKKSSEQILRWMTHSRDQQ